MSVVGSAEEAAEFGGLGAAEGLAVGGEEVSAAFELDAELAEGGLVEARMAACGEDAFHAAEAESGDAQEGFAVGGVDLDGEVFGVSEGPGGLGVEAEVEHGVVWVEELVDAEPVEADEPVGLVEAVFAQERRAGRWREAGVVGDGDVGGVVDAAESGLVVEPGGGAEDGEVGVAGGGDDHLGGLACGGEEGGPVGAAAFLAVGADGLGEATHRREDGGVGLFRCEGPEALFGGEFDVGGEAVGPEAGFAHEDLGGAGDDLHVDVAAEAVDGAEEADGAEHELHGVVGGSEDAGAEEESFDAVAAVEGGGEVGEFLGGEDGAGDVGAAADGAVGAVVDAETGLEDLEEADAAAVGGPDMADAAAGGAGAGAAARGAGGVVAGRLTEQAELLLDGHGGKIASWRGCRKRFFGVGEGWRDGRVGGVRFGGGRVLTGWGGRSILAVRRTDGERRGYG